MTRPSVPQGAQPSESLQDLYERACDLADAEQHAEAVVLFRQAAARGHAHAWLALGNSLSSLDLPAEAAEAYRVAAESGDPDAFLNLGLLQEDQQDWSSAERAYRQAQSVGDPRAVMALGNLWRYHGDPDAAKDLLRQAAAAADAHAAGYLGIWLHTEAPGLNVPDAEVPDTDVEGLLRQGADVVDDARDWRGSFGRVANWRKPNGCCAEVSEPDTPTPASSWRCCWKKTAAI